MPPAIGHADGDALHLRSLSRSLRFLRVVPRKDIVMRASAGDGDAVAMADQTAKTCKTLRSRPDARDGWR
jgi:hypothetical protein